MAIQILKDAVITINGVALSDHANSVTLTYEAEQVDVSCFDGSGARKFSSGLINMSCEIALMQDFAASSVEATVFGLVGTVTNVTVKATSAATSSTNPLYTITGAYLASHTPVAGGIGEPSTTTLVFNGGTFAKSTGA